MAEPLTYSQAKQHGAMLEAEVDRLSKALKALAGDDRSAMGLVAEHIRTSPEYRATKKALDRSFAELRAFNGAFVKHFKREIAAERKKISEERQRRFNR